ALATTMELTLHLTAPCPRAAPLPTSDLPLSSVGAARCRTSPRRSTTRPDLDVPVGYAFRVNAVNEVGRTSLRGRGLSMGIWLVFFFLFLLVLVALLVLVVGGLLGVFLGAIIGGITWPRS